MPNFPKPTALKLLQGNPGKRPISKDEPKPEKGIPPMPVWLEAFPIAVKEWKRETNILHKVGLITIADEAIMAQRAYLAHLVQTLSWEVKHEGHTVMSVNGGVRTNPKMNQLLQAISEHRRIGYMLGLDPSSRSRLHTGKGSEEDDPFEEFDKR